MPPRASQILKLLLSEPLLWVKALETLLYVMKGPCILRHRQPLTSLCDFIRVASDPPLGAKPRTAPRSGGSGGGKIHSLRGGGAGGERRQVCVWGDAGDKKGYRISQETLLDDSEPARPPYRSPFGRMART